MVSIIIPVYNGEKHIPTILNCFKKQVSHDFEIIFINDGSKDNTQEVLTQEKKKSDLNITIINQNNAGVSSARNVGIDEAKGNLICFCDVDDEVTVNYISDMCLVMEDNDVDLVICKNQLKRANGTGENISTKPDTGQVEIKNTLSCLKDFLFGRIVSGCWTIMIRKNILDNNLRFAEGFKYSEDLHMLWRIIAFSEKIAYLDKSLYIYNLQDNSATSRFDTERMHGYTLFKDLEAFFDIHAPLFAKEYRAYGAAKMMWSIVWQASTYYDIHQFINFIRKHKVKNEMKKLLSFKNYKVSLSAATFIISPALFRFLAIKFGKIYIH